MDSVCWLFIFSFCLRAVGPDETIYIKDRLEMWNLKLNEGILLDASDILLRLKYSHHSYLILDGNKSVV